ncbi:MAG: DUF6125 family protein [Candidatus Hodarchaeota archaeon]
MDLPNPLERLTRNQLLDLIKMFSKNWLTVDGIWFTLVEDRYGLDTALDLDLKMWERNAIIEAQRIKKCIGIPEGEGIKSVLNAIHFMTHAPSMPFEYSIDGPDQAHFWFTRCRPQEGRGKAGRGEFPCKPMGLACYGGLAKIIDPIVKVECVFCPPDDHPSDVWCKWRLTSNKR